MKNNPLEKSWEKRTKNAHDRAMKGIEEMVKKGIKINFNSVQKYTGVCRDFLYADKEVCDLITAARSRGIAEKQREEEDAVNAELSRLRMEVRTLTKENEELKKQINAPHEYIGKSYQLEKELKALKAQNEHLNRKVRELEKQLETAYAF